MLITKDFVMLNFPKTGSSFARKAIKEVYQNNFYEYLAPNNWYPQTSPLSPHVAFTQIPKEHTNKPVVSIYRNPFDRYVSLWFFKWYAHTPPADTNSLRKRFKNFPELTFEEYLDLTNTTDVENIMSHFGFDYSDKLGIQTVQFIVFYAVDPVKCLGRAIKNQNLDLQDFLPAINFLKQDSLRMDLINYLQKFSMNDSLLQIIESSPEENVSRSQGNRDWRQFWSNEKYAEFAEKEKILLNFAKKLGCSSFIPS